MTASKIEWTDRSDWNPIRGCTRVSPGCGGPGDHGGCYAEAMAGRFSLPGMWGHGFAEMSQHRPRWTGKVELQADRLTLPLSWKKPAKVFASSTSDFFHEKLSDDDIDQLFAVMALCPQQTFQVLTKRPERMQQYLTADGRADSIGDAMMQYPEIVKPGFKCVSWPLPNVWLGVSAERQQEANERIPLLLQTPAAVRFVSCEPLLGPIDLTNLDPTGIQKSMNAHGWSAIWKNNSIGRPTLDWVIAGGESGPRARPMSPGWAMNLCDQCIVAGVPFFFKQWGEYRPCNDEREVARGAILVGQRDACGYYCSEEHGHVDHGGWWMIRVGKSHAGALLDGREHKAFPELRT